MSDRDPIDAEHADPAQVGSLQLDATQLPIYDLADFNDADVHRVSSFVTTFGSWQLPAEVATVLAAPDLKGTLIWIHDTGELVLVGGTPKEGEVAVEVDRLTALESEMTPAFLGGEGTGVHLDTETGMYSESFKSELLPAGSRVALLAHIERGPRVHELLWGWHHEHDHDGGWDWLVERLARLEESDDADHLG